MNSTYFFAVRLPPDLCDRLAPGLRALGEIAPSIRPVRADGLHLTVQFLGRPGPELVAALPAVGASVASRQPAFNLELGEPGRFGPERNPRVIWLSVRQGAAELAELNRRLAVALDAAGLPCDRRRFLPHCTVARVSGELTPAGGSCVTRLAGELATVARDPVRVTEIQLLQSVPVPGGQNRYVSGGAFALS